MGNPFTLVILSLCMIPCFIRTYFITSCVLFHAAGLTFSSHLHPSRLPTLQLPSGTGRLGAVTQHQLDIDQLEAVKRGKGVKRPLPTDGRIRLLKQLHLKILERRSDQNLKAFRNVLAMKTKTSSKNGRIRLL